MHDKLTNLLDLFLTSRFYRPLPAVLSESEAELARKMPGHRFELVPPEMLAGPPDTAGLAPWVPIESPLSESLVAGIERFLRVRLPPLFKRYLSFKCLLSMDLYEATLPDVDPQRPFAWLEWCAL